MGWKEWHKHSANTNKGNIWSETGGTAWGRGKIIPLGCRVQKTDFLERKLLHLPQTGTLQLWVEHRIIQFPAAPVQGTPLRLGLPWDGIAAAELISQRTQLFSRSFSPCWGSSQAPRAALQALFIQLPSSTPGSLSGTGKGNLENVHGECRGAWGCHPQTWLSLAPWPASVRNFSSVISELFHHKIQHLHAVTVLPKPLNGSFL